MQNVYFTGIGKSADLTKLVVWNRLGSGVVCFYGQVAMNFGILRRILITLAFGNVLVLSSFASNTPSASMEHKQEISEISTKFYDHIKNSKQKLPKEYNHVVVEGDLSTLRIG